MITAEDVKKALERYDAGTTANTAIYTADDVRAALRPYGEIPVEWDDYTRTAYKQPAQEQAQAAQNEGSFTPVRDSDAYAALLKRRPQTQTQTAQSGGASGAPASLQPEPVVVRDSDAYAALLKRRQDGRTQAQTQTAPFIGPTPAEGADSFDFARFDPDTQWITAPTLPRAPESSESSISSVLKSFQTIPMSKEYNPITGEWEEYSTAPLKMPSPKTPEPVRSVPTSVQKYQFAPEYNFATGEMDGTEPERIQLTPQEIEAARQKAEADAAAKAQGGRLSLGISGTVQQAAGSVPYLFALGEQSVKDFNASKLSPSYLAAEKEWVIALAARQNYELTHPESEWQSGAALALQAALDAAYANMKKEEVSTPVSDDTVGSRMMRAGAQKSAMAVAGLDPTQQFIADTAMSIGQNVALLPLAAVNPALPLAAMGSVAAAQKGYEVTEQGGGAGEALSRGLVSGGIEILTEKLPLDNLLGMLRTGGGKSAVRTALKQMGIESSEEAASYLLNYISDAAAHDPNAKFSFREMFKQALAGGISGLVLSGGALTARRTAFSGQNTEEAPAFQYEPLPYAPQPTPLPYAPQPTPIPYYTPQTIPYADLQFGPAEGTMGNIGWTSDQAAVTYAYESGGELLPNVEKVTVDTLKVTEYALNSNNTSGGANKARVFESALGYNQSNSNHLMQQIQSKLPTSKAILGTADKYGQRFTVDIPIIGPNGKTAIVRTGWILEPGSDVPRMTTIFVK